MCIHCPWDVLSTNYDIQSHISATPSTGYCCSQHTVHLNIMHTEVVHGRFKILTHVRNLLLDSSLRQYVISEHFRIYVLNLGTLSPASIVFTHIVWPDVLTA